MDMTAMMYALEPPHGMPSSGECVMITGLAGLHPHHAEVIVAEMTMDLRGTGIIMKAASVGEVDHDLLPMVEGTAAGIGREA